MSSLGWKELFKDAVVSALRNPGDVSGTLQSFNSDRAKQEYRTRMLARVASLGVDLEAQRIEALTWQAKRLAEGHSVNLETVLRSCTILGDHLAIIRFHRGGEAGRVDVFYGGRESPRGTGHGHIVVKNGKMTHWRTEEPNAMVLVDE